MNTSVRKITLDATNKRIGRFATEIADILNGKDTPEYMPNRVPNVRIEVINASRMQITERKKKGKMYESYSGYFGGRKEISLGQLIEKKGFSAVLRKAVYGMLPNNRLRSVKMKKIQIQE